MKKYSHSTKNSPEVPQVLQRFHSNEAQTRYPQNLRLEVQNLRLHLGGRQIIDGVGLQIETGELLGIIGPNGSGKTSLLKCLINLYRFEGDIRYSSKSVADMPARERSSIVGYLSQRQNISMAFRVGEIVEMGNYGKHLSFAESTRRAKQSLCKLGMESEYDRIFHELSGGEQQLVLLARLLAQEAPLLLLDEPTASLDIGQEKRILQVIQSLCCKERSAIVAIHNLNCAAEYCDRLVLLNKGRVVKEGLVEEVFKPEILEEVYRTKLSIYPHPKTGRPQVFTEQGK